jgi:hypothetical protein
VGSGHFCADGHRRHDRGADRFVLRQPGAWGDRNPEPVDESNSYRQQRTPADPDALALGLALSFAVAV